MAGCVRIIPLTLREANALVATLHRHHKPARGCKFCIGLVGKDGQLHGAAIVGRPVARACDQRQTAEVTRLVTDGTPNACSKLYAACARTAKEMGFSLIQTYILQTEPGTSLKASGWRLASYTKGGSWNNGPRSGRREDQPLMPKQRWEKNLDTTTGHVL